MRSIVQSSRNLKASNSLLIFKLPQIIILFTIISSQIQLSYGLKYLQPKNTNSTSFKIAIFADLHFGEDAWSDWGPKQDVNSIKAMSSLLDHENPDFVVYLGDVVTANNVPISNASLYWDQATSPTRDRGIPWAGVFGNHDDSPFQWPLEWFSEEGVPPLHCSLSNSSSSNSSSIGDGDCSFTSTSRVELMNHQIGNNTFSFSEHGPKNLWPSVSNYVLQVSSSRNPRSPVAFMYFLDSGGGSYREIISSAQTEWLKSVFEEINPDRRIPEIFFWHIPSIAYKKVSPWLFFVPRPCVGSINKELVCTQEGEMGIMKVLKDRPSVQAVFVGHDHGNDWCCPYGKMWLCYGRHTGYGGYGKWARGARILEIVDQPYALKSWIRMEDGFVHSHILLSSQAESPAPYFLLLVLVLFLVLFLGITSFYHTNLVSKAKAFISPTGCLVCHGDKDRD